MMKILQIENKAGKLKLNEYVHKDSVDRLIQEIETVFGATAASNGADFGELTNSIENAADSLEIEIHSPGGSVLDGHRIYNAITKMRERGVHVTAKIDTLAASMASVIAMAADKVQIVSNGRMMIHEVSSITAGNAEDHANAAKLLDDMSEQIAEIYANKTNGDKGKIRKLMKKETWMNAEQALEAGFADEILKSKFDTKTESKNMNILDRLTSPSNEESLAKIEALENAAQAHETELSEINGKLTIAENALQEAVTGWTEVKNSLATAQARVSELEAKTTEQEAKIAELEEAAVVSAERISNEASRILGNSGGTALDDAENDDEKPTDFLAQYRELQKTNPREATAFWEANKSKIIK